MATADAKPPELQISVSEIPGPDFTVYREKLDFIPDEEHPVAQAESRDSAQDGKGQKNSSYSGPVTITTGESTGHGEWKPEGPPVYGRALACRAYGGRYWSITVRCDKKNLRKPDEVEAEGWAGKLTAYASKESATGQKEVKCGDLVGYCPKGHPDVGKAAPPKQPDTPKVAAPPKQADTRKGADPSAGREIFLNDMHTVCQELERILFDEDEPHPHGLIAITGATDSSKSFITRGLIFLHLQKAAAKARLKGHRRPHLVTFEDPVEQYYVKDPQSEPSPRLSVIEDLLDGLYVDYTPREKGKDADSLRQVTKDALRQTPSVLFVGETREQGEWKDLLEFAGSNHLVITTSHASSVVEAMSGIFRAAGVETPARRSEVARRILGIINVRSFSPKDTKDNIRALLPSVWKRTSQSMNNLIADGLASILPESRRVELGGGRDEPNRKLNYYGRAYFAGLLTEADHDGKPRMSASMEDCEDRGKALEQIKRQAIEWDLKGV